MGAIHLLLLICLIGFVVWLIQRFAPIPAQFKTVILWVAVVIVILIILQAFGILGMDVGIPKIR